MTLVATVILILRVGTHASHFALTTCAYSRRVISNFDNAAATTVTAHAADADVTAAAAVIGAAVAVT